MAIRLLGLIRYDNAKRNFHGDNFRNFADCHWFRGATRECRSIAGSVV
jgi:hypothetical protein